MTGQTFNSSGKNTSKQTIITAICTIGNGIWGFNLCLGSHPAHLAGLKQTHKQDPQRLTDTNWQQRSPNSCVKLGSVTSFKHNLSVVTAFSVSLKEEREGRIAVGAQTERESWGRNWEIWMKTKECWKWKIFMKDKEREAARMQGWRRKKRKERKKYFFLPVIDMVSAMAIRVRKTHQRFVCSVRVN